MAHSFIGSNSFGWWCARVATVVVSGALATVILLLLLPAHCSKSGVYALGFGPPLGFAISTGILSYSRFRRRIPTTVMTLLVGLGSLITFTLTVPNQLGAIDVGKQKRTMSDMRRIARAIEEGRPIDVKYDAWGTPYSVRRAGASYTIVSFGNCGVPDVPVGSDYPPAQTFEFDADIVFTDGRFIRYPEGRQP